MKNKNMCVLGLFLVVLALLVSMNVQAAGPGGMVEWSHGLMVADVSAPATDVVPVSADASIGVADAVTSFLTGLSQKYPWIITVLLIIGALRVVIKPLMSAAHSIAAATPGTDDDKIVDKVEHSKIYGWLCFALDWLTSIKLVK